MSHARSHTNDPVVKYKHTRSREIPGPTPHSVAVIAKPPRKEPADKLILDRRVRDYQIIQAKEYLGGIKNCDVHMQWESRNEKRIENNQIAHHINDELVTCEFALEARKQRLRDLLRCEDDDYHRELVDSQETTIERQAKMRQRAKQLKEKRETSRLQIVHDKYEQRWRDQCEELRSILSKQTLNEISFQRNDQIREKMEADSVLKEDDKMYAQMWYDDIKSKADKEEQMAKKKMESNNELIDVLQKQMAAIEFSKQREVQLRQDEAELLKEQAILRDAEEQQRLQEKRRSQADTRDTYKQSANLKQARTAQRLQEELAFDMRQLEQLLQVTRDEAMEISTRKVEMKEENNRYREYLSHMKNIERQRELEVQGMCDIEVERLWQEKIRKWQLERNQRKKLLAEVMEGRRKQVLAKEERIAAERAITYKEKAELMKVIQYNVQMEKNAEAQRRDEKVKHQTDVLSQIAYNERQSAERKLQTQQLYGAEQLARREYQLKLEDTLDEARNGMDRVNSHPIRRHHYNRLK